MEKDLKKIKIGGLEPASMLERPGYLSAMVFLAGCNFRCPYCHNPELVKNIDKLTLYPLEEFFSALKKKKGWIDSVIFTGGEPTLWPNLPGLIKEVRKIGFETGVHTNGTNPKMLKELIEKKLVEYAAMDVKGTLKKYSKNVGVKVDPNLIRESIDIIRKNRAKLETIIRITVVPRLIKEEDFEEIGKLIQGVDKVSIQQFRPGKCLDKNFHEVTPYSKELLLKFAKQISKYVNKVEKEFI